MIIPLAGVYIFIFVISIVARFIFTRLKVFYSNKMFLCLMSVVIAIVNRFKPSMFEVRTKMTYEPRTLLLIYMPLLTMKSCYNSRKEIVLKSVPYLILQATVILPLSALCHGLFMRWCIFESWSVKDAVMFGTIFVIMQPNCFVHLMQTYKHYLPQTIVQYDSFLSVATIIILFDIVNNLYYVDMDLNDVVRKTFAKIFFGLLLGYLVGVMAKFLLKYTTHEPKTYVIIIMINFITVFYVCFFIHLSATSSMITIGPILLLRDHHDSDELQAILGTFIFVLFFIADSFIYLYCFYGLALKSLFVQSGFIKVIIGSYFSFITTRSLAALIMQLISRLYTKDITFRNTLLICCSTVSSNVGLILLNIIYYREKTHILAKQIIPQAVFVSIVTHTLHQLFFYLLTKSQTFTQKAKVQVSNLNRCLEYLAEQRLKYISMWRMKSSMSNTHWDVVEKLTALQDSNSMKDYDSGHVVATCPSCYTTITAELPPVTVITQDVKRKLLGELKIITFRQAELCLISGDTSRIVANLIEKVYASDSNSFDHNGFRVYYKRNALLDKVTKRYFSIFKFDPNDYPMPRKTIRRFCYRILRTMIFKLIMTFFIITSMIPVALVLISDSVWFLPLNMLFFTVFLSEMVINVLSYSSLTIKEGLKIYFCSYWNIFDFVMICCYSALFSFEILIRFIHFPEIPRAIRGLVIFKIFDIFKGCIPNILNMLRQGVESRISTGYECIQVLYMAYTEILVNLKRIIKESTKLEQCCREYVESERMEFMKLLFEIHIEVPWSVKVTKTKIMLNVLNNYQFLTIEDIKTEGYIDNFECDNLRQFVNMTEKKMQIPPEEMKTDLNDILSNVQWLQTSSEALDYLSHASSTFRYKANTIICKPGDSLDGIYIIASGVLKLTYVPNKEIIYNMYNYGHVPVVDYIDSNTLDRSWTDILLPGNSFGELSYLTGRPNDITVECLTPVTVIFMQQRHLEIASAFSFDGIAGISQHMWKYSMINIIVGIFLKESAYDHLNKLELLQKVINGFVPDLSYYKYFYINDKIEEILLLNGQCVDFYTNELFTAPCFIPRCSFKLCFPMADDGLSAVLFIIPTSEANQFEIMDAAESTAEMHANYKLDNSKSLKVLNTKREIFKRRTTQAASVYEPGELLQRKPFGFNIGM